MARSKSVLVGLCLCAALCCALCASAWGQAAALRLAGVAPADASKGGSKLMPLVNADPDNATILARIETLIADKAYPDAIRLLQEMIDKGEGFFETGDGHLYVSLRVKALEMLGKLGPEGLDLYRAMNDAQAQRLYQEGLEGFDLPQLQRVTDRYLYTTSGPRAMDALAGLYFDSGKFLQAAYYWKRLWQMDPKGEAAALYKAKMVLAMYLGGEPGGADAALAEMKQESPQAKALLGGREQNLVEFVDQVRKAAVVSSSAVTVAPSGGYPGWGALPGGFTRMADVDVILSPRWRQPEADPNAGADILKDLLIVKSSLAPSNQARYGNQGFKTVAELRNGQVRVRAIGGNNPMYGVAQPGIRDYSLPGMLLPVVADGKVIVRTASRIEAYGLLDGELKWASEQPLMRSLGSRANRGYMPYQQQLRVTDAGRHGVTVGGGKVFFLSNFRPPVQNLNMGMPAPPRDENLVDNSKIVALWANSGKLVDGWEVGCGKGGDEIIRAGKFISAPAYANGRVYALAVYLENGFYLVCLDANDGSLIWKQFLAQSPGVNPNMGYLNDNYHYGSPPVVADGRVYALTNIGVIAAADANSGQPIWAYQYDSQVVSMLQGSGMGGAYFNLRSANPIIVTRGRVICLPADCAKVLAVSSEDGTPIWQSDRQGRGDLSGIDENRILISGDGLSVLSTQDGQEVFSSGEITGVNGRPAVTVSSILACGSGVMYRVSLSDYGISRVELTDADGLLGNLVSAEGKLIAANPLGMCAYFKFEDARDELTRRIESAKPAEKPDMLMHRALLSFSAGRYADAAADYKACLSPATSQPGDAGQKARLGAQLGLYRTYVMMGNVAPDPEEMLARFGDALAISETPSQKAQMKMRLAKALAQGQRFDQAAAAAQDISEQMGDVEIVEIDVGPSARDVARFTAKDPTAPAGEVAQEFIGQLIGAHGRACYKAFDDLAQKEYKAALAAGDSIKLEGVYSRWPKSEFACDALYSAAELSYKASLAQTGDESEQLVERAIRLLHAIHNEPASPRYVGATVALASIYSRAKWGRNYAAILLDAMREQPADTPIAFGDLRGKLGEVLAMIDAGQMPKLPAAIRPKSNVEMPLREIFTLADSDCFILRDQNYNPLRIGQSIAVLRGSRIVMLDASARTAELATASWSGLSSARGDIVRQRPANSPQVVCALSDDGKIVAVADSDAVTGLDAATAKIRWQKKMTEMGVGSPVSLSMGAGYMVATDASGNMACVDLATGEHWQNLVPVAKGNPQTGQPGGVIGLPQIGGGLVVVPINSMRSLLAYNLKSGKILQRWDSSKTADAMITPDGMLVTVIDQELAVRELAQLDKPLWTRKYDGSKAPILLAVSKEWIAVSLQRNSGQIEVLPVTGGGKVGITLRTADAGGGMAVPADGRFEGNSLFVTCSAVFVMPRRANPSQAVVARGMSVQRFDVDSTSADPVWSRTVGGDTQSVDLLLPLVVGRQVIVTLKSNRPDKSGSLLVLDAKTGQVLDKNLSLAGRGADGKGDRSRYQAVATPALLDGRLCVETNEGVTVYGK